MICYRLLTSLGRGMKLGLAEFPPSHHHTADIASRPGSEAHPANTAPRSKGASIAYQRLDTPSLEDHDLCGALRLGGMTAPFCGPTPAGHCRNSPRSFIRRRVSLARRPFRSLPVPKDARDSCFPSESGSRTRANMSFAHKPIRTFPPNRVSQLSLRFEKAVAAASSHAEAGSTPLKVPLREREASSSNFRAWNRHGPGTIRRPIGRCGRSGNAPGFRAPSSSKAFRTKLEGAVLALRDVSGCVDFRVTGYVRSFHQASWFRMGKLRMRLPMAAWIALARAGATGGRPGSPTPPNGAS